MLPKTIQASVHPDAISKVTSFFNASLADMVREVFQNARRSGATKIEVTSGEGELTIRDNGGGIEDPGTLLAFGKSSWDDREHERPAGMGLYSLGGTTTEITSRTADMQYAWRVRLEPQHYRGDEAAAIEHVVTETAVGTAVRIRTREPQRGTVVRAAQYLPVQVIRNGIPIDQKRFEDREKNAGVVRDDDLTILVRETYDDAMWGASRRGKSNARTSTWSRINFHGHVVREENLGMPAANGLDRAWYVEIDVGRCPELQLVLPARKETVRNEFLDELRTRAERAIFESIEKMKPPPRLPHRTWLRGAEVLGRELPVARIELREWQPATTENADSRGSSQFDENNPLRPVNVGGLIVPKRTRGPEQMLIDHALNRRGSGTGPTLYEEEPRYEGFPEYDALRRVSDVQVRARSNGEWRDASKESERPVRDEIVEEIVLVIELHDRATGKRSTITVDSDVGFCNTFEGGEPDGVGILVKGNEIDRDEIADLIMTGYYQFDEGADESDSTQREQYIEAIENQLGALLLTSAEHRRRRIRSTLNDSIAAILPKDVEITIRYTPYGKCEIDGLEAREETSR